MKTDLPPGAGRDITVVAQAVVVYRPEPSVWFFVVFTVGALFAGLSLLSGWKAGEDDPRGLLILLWPFAPVMLWSGRKRFVITRDDHLQCLRLELQRWPWASQVSTYPLAEVRDAIVELDMMGESLTHRVVLVMRSGEQVPLTKSFCSRGSHHERAVLGLRALLNRASDKQP